MSGAPAGPAGRFFYRYSDRMGDDGPSISLDQYPVVRETPAGVWLNLWSEKKFVLNATSGREKRWAYENKEHAREDFRQRRLREQVYLKRRLAVVEFSLNRCLGEDVLEFHPQPTKGGFFEFD